MIFSTFSKATRLAPTYPAPNNPLGSCAPHKFDFKLSLTTLNLLQLLLIFNYTLFVQLWNELDV